MALLAAVAARALLPWVLKWSIEWQGTKQLGRLVEVGDVDLALFRGGFAIEDLAVGPIFEGEEPPPLDPQDAHFRSARIEVNWSWLALLRRELHIEEIALVAPELLAVRGADGHLVPVLRPRPPAAQSTAQADEAEQPGAPWPLLLDRLRLRDLRLLYVDLTAGGLHPLELDMDQFALDALALRGEDVALGGLGLRGPRLRLRRDIDLAPFTAGAPEAAPAAESAPVSQPEAAPLSYRVAEVALERAGLQLVLGEREIETRLSLHAREISGAAGTRFPLELRLELEGGWLELQGEAGTAPAAFKGTLSWGELPLEPLAAGAELPITIASGRSSGALEIDALLAGAPERGPSRVDVSGRAQVDALDAATSDESMAVSWSLFELELGGLALRPDGEGDRPTAPAVELAALRLRDPAVRLVRRKAAEPETPAEPAVAAEPTAPEPAGEAAPAPELRLALLELSGGSAEFVDETVTPNYRSRIRELSVRGRDLRWPERDARELVVAWRGPEDASFALDASLRGGNGRVKLDLADLGLAAFSPYAAGAAGYWIEGGNASLRAELGVAGGAYDLDSDLGLHQLHVAEVEPGSFEKQFGVPLDLGLALLRDPADNIGIPIGAKLEGGKTRLAVASVVAAALRQALVGALSAPLKGLGMLVGSGEGSTGLGLEPLAAEPGARAPELAQLGPLAELLESRPGLGLRLRGRVGPEDEPALAERILMEQVVAEAELPPVEAGFLQKRRLRGALAERARGETGGLDAEDEAALARWIESVEVTDAERSALAEARATAVRDALVGEHGIAAQRIQLGAALEGTPGVVIELAPAPR